MENFHSQMELQLIMMGKSLLLIIQIAEFKYFQIQENLFFHLGHMVKQMVNFLIPLVLHWILMEISLSLTILLTKLTYSPKMVYLSPNLDLIIIILIMNNILIQLEWL